jgi:hypothetical protein
VATLTFFVFKVKPNWLAVKGMHLYNACNFVAGWSSLVARRAHNPKVVGSNPAPATRILQCHTGIGVQKPLFRGFLLISKNMFAGLQLSEAAH